MVSNETEIPHATPVAKTTSNNVYSADGTPLNDVSSTKDNAIQESPINKPVVVVPNDNAPQVMHNHHYVQIDSRKPVMLTYCPKCAEEQMLTDTKTKATGTTWVCVLAGFFIFWPLCWLPLTIRPMKQTNHYCSKCGVKVGRVKPFQ